MSERCQVCGVEMHRDDDACMYDHLRPAPHASREAVQPAVDREKLIDKVSDILDDNLSIEYDYSYPQIEGKYQACEAVTDAILTLTPGAQPEPDPVKAVARGYGASRNQETGKWVLYEMPGVKPIGVEAENRDACERMLTALRSLSDGEGS